MNYIFKAIKRKIKFNSSFSKIKFLDNSESCIPKKCDVIVELEK